MGWTITTDVHAFEAAAGALLRADPITETIAVVRLEAALRRPVPGERYGWWTDPTGAVAGAVLHTRQRPVLLGPVPEPARRPLVAALCDRPEPVDGINGPADVAAQLGALWRARTGGRVELTDALRLFALGRLVEPTVPGRARVATTADRRRLLDWQRAFEIETRDGTSPDAEPQLTERIDEGRMTVWEGPDGEPAAMAGRTPVVAGMSRVAWVFTPVEHRRHGYAAAVTAAVSAQARPLGEVLLFTDLTNPTSNAIYQRLGYRPVVDRSGLAFRSAASSSRR